MGRNRQNRTTSRKATIAVKSLTREVMRLGAAENPPVEGVDRPRTWGECRAVLDVGPCPFVSCKHHLYLDINPHTGSIILNFPDLEPWELNHSCSLDVTDGGELTLDIVGARMNLTRERIRQVETRAMHRLADVLRARRIVERAAKQPIEPEVAA